MVFDRLENAKLYYGLGPAFEKALRGLEALDFSALEPGRKYELGDGMGFNLQEIEGAAPDDDFYEAHVKYADIQLVISGTEYMGIANISALAQREPYNGQKDIAWYSGQGSMLKFQPGDFAVFFPGDAHMPCRSDGKTPCFSKKIVVKVPL